MFCACCACAPLISTRAVRIYLQVLDFESGVLSYAKYSIDRRKCCPYTNLNCGDIHHTHPTETFSGTIFFKEESLAYPTKCIVKVDITNAHWGISREISIIQSSVCGEFSGG
ncbi:hypothetical protein CC80DRAFT_8315 [Byssothecium circinans]|uniref:Uncharacterized protein n=1 Tax=Byssothecium circinans TaxID=147558 RepID=A0A6A5UGT6_9PLEO|nr:hypothetical protein CC80DRAFT_8315 [Byssothecium circinans]